MFSKKSAILSASLLVGLAAVPSFGQNAGGNGGGNNGGNNQNNGGGNGGGNNGGGRPDFRQQMADRMKQELGMTDDEYTAIQPKIEAIMQIERSMQAGRMGMFGGGQGGRGGRNRGGNNGGNNGGGAGGGNNAAGGGGGGNAGGGNGGGGNNAGGGGPGGPGGPGGGQNDNSPMAVATKDLQTVTANKDATPDDIKAKLQAFRDAKAKTKDELTKAQADLKELVSQKQEAVLVQMGILE